MELDLELEFHQENGEILKIYTLSRATEQASNRTETRQLVDVDVSADVQ